MSEVHAIAARAWMLSGVLLAGSACGGCGRTPAEAACGFVRTLGGRAASIRRLDLAQTTATDADLERLVALGGDSLADVAELDLTRTPITDRGLDVIGGFPRLTKLTLTLTRVTDDGLAALAVLGQLTDLALVETGITDAAVASLCRLTSLRRLVLLRTGLSAAGIARLRQCLPRAAIHIEPVGARGRRGAR